MDTQIPSTHKSVENHSIHKHRVDYAYENNKQNLSINRKSGSYSHYTNDQNRLSQNYRHRAWDSQKQLDRVISSVLSPENNLKENRSDSPGQDKRRRSSNPSIQHVDGVLKLQVNSEEFLNAKNKRRSGNNLNKKGSITDDKLIDQGKPKISTSQDLVTERNLKKVSSSGKSSQNSNKSSTLHYSSSSRKKKKKKTNFFIQLLQNLGLINRHVEFQDPKTDTVVKATGLTQSHLRKLRKKFTSIDIDGSGTIDAEEFLESIGELASPFTKHLFHLIDIDSSGTIEFDEYVRVLIKYCMFSKDDILRFCFECFDVDKSGNIDEKEFILLCTQVNNSSPAFPSNFRRALQDFDENNDGLIDFGEFCEINRRFPLILFPAFRLQDIMQKQTLGEATWLQIIRENAKRRQKDQFSNSPSENNRSRRPTTRSRTRSTSASPERLSGSKAAIVGSESNTGTGSTQSSSSLVSGITTEQAKGSPVPALGWQQARRISFPSVQHIN